MTQYRIREVIINDDNKWYFPEILIEKEITKGILWWKKKYRQAEWNKFYETGQGFALFFTDKEFKKSSFSHLENNLIGFDSFDEATLWLDSYKKYIKEYTKDLVKKYTKEDAAKEKNDYKTKIHEIK